MGNNVFLSNCEHCEEYNKSTSVSNVFYLPIFLSFLPPLISGDAGKAFGSLHSNRFSNTSLSGEGRLDVEVVGHTWGTYP